MATVNITRCQTWKRHQKFHNKSNSTLISIPIRITDGGGGDRRGSVIILGAKIGVYLSTESFYVSGLLIPWFKDFWLDLDVTLWWYLDYLSFAADNCHP